MHIVSYRGPNQAGGVASLLQRGQLHYPDSSWWYFQNTSLQVVSSHSLSRVANVPAEIIDGHYRYCNEFLWPLMHERPEFAQYSAHDHNCYRSLNIAVASHLNWNRDGKQSFINDYQFALLPSYLSEERASRSICFWHIVWPATFPEYSHTQIAELASSMLNCQTIGFHTREYVENFGNFVIKALPGYSVAANGNTIIHPSGKQTQLVASPAGVDYLFWHQAAREDNAPAPSAYPYILSVDRADYTKGILERIEAIKMVFDSRPKLKGKIQFVFVCQQTRNGLESFDQYWQDCRAKYQELIAEMSTESWSPIVWITEPISHQVLASWYARAEALLVNSSRDGLNLTAKEFIASTMDRHNMLIISRGTGAWHELKNNVVTIPACRPKSIAKSILKSLQMPMTMRRVHLNRLKQTVLFNSSQRWWHHLTGEMSAEDNKSQAMISA